MRLRLVITTDGREGLLERALESYDQHVRPRPVETIIVDDSGDPAYYRYLDDLLRYRTGVYGGKAKLVPHQSRQGFCETVADAWALAGDPRIACPGCDVERPDYDPDRDEETRKCRCQFEALPPKATAPEWVVWLEDDFVFERTIPLEDLAYVLDREPQVAQMALYRNAVSPEEKAAGGYMKIDPERFERRGSGTSTWIEHRAFWTTNPSIFRRQFAARFPWPVVPHCEGMFTHSLIADWPEMTFGIWGDGTSPWVRHDADRVGRGY